MNTNVLFAVFKRNFVSYFANPTGYVFICLFGVLSSVAAFWTDEFFNANLANLNQLNFWFPFIMLFFVPAITMSIWADERRQGTDELLLTIPAGDLEIVLGKYLAAVSIYTVALLFSLVCNFLVLKYLGTPDLGLFLGTYLGYWLVGLAMLSIGMVASFLTSNLTVAYILGAALNAPLVFLISAESYLPPAVANVLKPLSIGAQLYDFGRGVLSLSAVFYFLMIVAIMLYLCMVLIGRRHWFVGGEHRAMVGHYAARAIALMVVAIAGTYLLSNHDVRADMTSERLNTLSPETRRIIAEIKPESPVRIEAFVSPTVPESYVQTRLNLLSALRELDAMGGDRIRVNVTETERFTEEATRAEERYQIEPRQVSSLERGRFSQDHIFLHVAVSSGREKVGPVFFDRGVPVEYELVRSIATVSNPQRKKVGVVATDAQLFGGGFGMMGPSPTPDWPIIDELKKQYEVVRVDPTQPIEDEYDALLAVQPSSLGPEEMNNFVAAVRTGIPTAVFEDPFPYLVGSVPATSAPKQGGGGMMGMMGGGNMPKGDINQLWNLLGVDFAADKIVWQKFNPYTKVEAFDDEFVFVQSPHGSFDERNPVSSRLQQLLFPYPGAIQGLNVSQMSFDPLVKTGQNTGTIGYGDIVSMSFMGQSLNPNRANEYQRTGQEYVLAAVITGKVPENQNMAADEDAGDIGGAADTEPTVPAADAAAPAAGPAPDAAGTDVAAEPMTDGAESDAATETGTGAEQKPARPKRDEIHVVLVADLDMLTPAFFRIREQGEIPEADVHFDFDNVTFVLNAIDHLTGQTQLIELRKRRPQHRILTRVEKATEAAREEALAEREKLRDEIKQVEQREREALQKKIANMQKSPNANTMEMIQQIAIAQQEGERRMDTALEMKRQERDQRMTRINTDLKLERDRLQNMYKAWALALPLLLPLCVGVVVFLLRRARETEGVAKTRMR
ncbi:MAG: Gldg family protein [Planctomycetota bacterium]